jgi:hypothetical protein
MLYYSCVLKNTVNIINCSYLLIWSHWLRRKLAYHLLEIQSSLLLLMLLKQKTIDSIILFPTGRNLKAPWGIDNFQLVMFIAL